MLSMKAVDVIEKRYIDTGIIENDEIMGLVRTIRVKDQQLAGAAKTVENLSKDQVTIFRNGDGKLILTERTVNITEDKSLKNLSKVVVWIFFVVSIAELVAVIKGFF